MTTIVVGTAGHIDHGKTTLLRALTGIDADRLPEERRRGMTIDVGYAHLGLSDGSEIDFVDVPGHDRLVGNMLVGAGEIDAALLVIAADDGPRAQTREHLELLDALDIGHGIAAVTKTDLVSGDRVSDVIDGVRRLLESTGLAGSPILPVSSQSGAGLDDLRTALADLRDRASPATVSGARLAIDRVFSIKGRGTVVTGTLRGSIAPGDVLRVVPGERTVRVRAVQVHGAAVERSTGGRTALNLAAVEPHELGRGTVLATAPDVRASDRLLVVLRPSAGVTELVGPGRRLRLHLGTESVNAVVGRRAREFADLVDGRRVVVLRLERPIAVSAGDRFALRDPSPGSTAGGGVVVDPVPPRSSSRRRVTTERLAALGTGQPGRNEARLDLHGAIDGRLAADVSDTLRQLAIGTVAAHHEAEAASVGLPIATLRTELMRELRRLAYLDRAEAARLVDRLAEDLVTGNRLVREGDRIRLPEHEAGVPSALAAAMDRLEGLLSVAAPPPLAAAARAASCPPEGIRALETAGRITRVEDDLAWSATSYRELTDRALALADAAPLTPAVLRDATGTSRRYVLAILEDLDRRGVLRRTPDGHVRGPRVPARAG